MKYPMAGDLQRGTGVQLTGNPERKPLKVLRESWGSNTTIVIEDHPYGFAGWLESKQGGRLPISFGKTQPATAREAMTLAKAFLRKVHGRNNPEETFDTDILGGMERAIWVTSYADWVEGMTKKERQEAGAPVSLSGIDWDEEAPASPASALMAAEDLYLAYERANGKTPGDLFELAMAADRTRATDELADSFGHYLAMMALGHGVSWFDDHKKFPLKQPSFEASTFDGEEVTWSPMIRQFQNPAPRQRCSVDHEALKRDEAKWRRLKFVGHQHMPADAQGPAETLELRDCVCGSTIAKEVTP